MIELQHVQVWLAAINARVRTEIISYEYLIRLDAIFVPNDAPALSPSSTFAKLLNHYGGRAVALKFVFPYASFVFLTVSPRFLWVVGHN